MKEGKTIDFDEAIKSGRIFRGLVRMAQKGMYDGEEDCLLVDVKGYKVTVPRSECVVPANRQLPSMVGSTIDLVITLAPKGIPLIFGSQKAALEILQKPVLDALKAGEEMEGMVTTVLSYGAYIAVGREGVSGLLKNVDFSNDMTTVRDYYSTGDHIKVRYKRMSDNGTILFEAVEKRVGSDSFSISDFSPSQMVFGTVRSVKAIGTFVCIAPGLDVLCPTFEDGLLAEGDKVLVRITSVNEEEGKVRGAIKRVVEA